MAILATPTSELLWPFLPRVVVDWVRADADLQHREIEGSLAFVDISGFTRMTERLARRGKAGAEELADLLDATFAPLLEAAYADGAGLVKWGGDAVLLLFDGDDHAGRCCRAALEMQRRLRRGGRIATSAGPVNLRMSIGVHSGVFQFFLVGSVHRELILTGPGVTTTVELESAADAGEVLVSESTARALPAAAVGERKAGGLLLRAAPDVPFRPAPLAGPVAGVALTPYVPVELRERLLSGSPEPEHRAVTVAFIGFHGVHDLLERRGVDATAAALDELVSLIQSAALRHEVSFHESDIASDGGKVLLVAGAPRSTGADEERVLLALRAVAEYEGPLAVRAGVNRGHVFAGILGPPYRRTFSIKGDAVNLAARVMGRARAGEVLATRAVLERSAVGFRRTALEPFLVKGKSQPVEAFAVGEPLRGGSALPSATALHGRERELEVLDGLLADAREGRGRVVEIIGEPGIGKSRLVEEVRARAVGFASCGVVCEAYEALTPYFAMQQLLRTALGIGEGEAGAAAAERLVAAVGDAAPELAKWLPLIATVAGLEVEQTRQARELEEQARRRRLEQATASLLVRLLPGPVLVVVEDAHWLDEASGAVLRELSDRAVAAGWLVLITRRPVETGVDAGSWRGTVQVTPAPLGESAAAALIGSETAELLLAPHEIDALAARAGGNPLFLKELIAAARSRGAVDGLPDSIEAVIAAQIDRLPIHERTLLRYVSVLGQAFGEELVLAVLADELVPRGADPWAGLGEFLARDAPGALRFRHGLIRDAAYEGLSFRRRRLLHGRAGEAIERAAGAHADEHAELLSLHFFEAQRFAEAWQYSCLAGRRAQGKWANAEAAQFYGRALDAARLLCTVDDASVAAAAEALGDVNERLGKFAAASTAYGRARSLTAGDRKARARLLMKEGVLREHSGRYPEALRWYSRALALDDQADPVPERAELMIAYGGVRFRQGRSRAAIAWCERAVEHALAVGDRPGLAHGYYLLHVLHMSLGSPERVRYRELALPIYEELGDLTRQGYVLNNLGMDAYNEGRWTEAIGFYERSREALLRAGAWVEAADADNNIAEILSDQGHLDAAEQLVRATARTHRAASYPMGVAFSVQHLGRIAARAGRAAEAREVLGDALARWRAIGDEAHVIETEAKLVEAILLEGGGAEARAAVEQALVRAERLELIPWLLALLRRLHGAALAQTGERAAAVAVVERSVATARAAGARYELALSQQMLARLDPERSDAAHLRDEADALLLDLGVVATALIPVPAP